MEEDPQAQRGIGLEQACPMPVASLSWALLYRALADPRCTARMPRKWRAEIFKALMGGECLAASKEMQFRITYNSRSYFPHSRNYLFPFLKKTLMLSE
jgi:hypothetical protein